MKKLLSTLLICLMSCALTASLAAPALALVFTPHGEGGAEELPEHSLELGNLTIRAGEELSYTVVDAQFEADVAAGIHAGKLNVTITGPIVVANGRRPFHRAHSHRRHGGAHFNKGRTECRTRRPVPRDRHAADGRRTSRLCRVCPRPG